MAIAATTPNTRIDILVLPGPCIGTPTSVSALDLRDDSPVLGAKFNDFTPFHEFDIGQQARQ